MKWTMNRRPIEKRFSNYYNFFFFFDDLIAGKLAARIARKDSLALKLAMRPDRQELIDRGILHAQTERERHMQREAVGARLTRFTSLSLSLSIARARLYSPLLVDCFGRLILMMGVLNAFNDGHLLHYFIFDVSIHWD